MTEPVTRLFAERQPGPDDDQVERPFLGQARAIAQICATRMLLLIAVATGAGVWVYTIVAEPSRERLYAAVAFSVVFVLPQTLLYWKRG